MISCYYPSEETGEILCRKRQSKDNLRHESNAAERQQEPQMFSSQLMSLDGTNRVVTVYFKTEKQRIQVEIFRIRS